MKWILQRTGKFIWPVLLLCLFTVALTVAGVVQALAMRNFLDLAAAGDRNGFLRWFLVYFGLIFFQLFGNAGKNLLNQFVSSSFYNKVCLHFFGTVLTRSYGSLGSKHSGEYMQLISSDTNIVVSFVLDMPQQLCALFAQLIAASVCLGYLQGRLALLLLLCFVVMLLAGLPLRGFVRRYHKKVMEAQAKIVGILQESLNNQLVLRAFQAVSGVARQAKVRMNQFRAIVLRRAFFSQLISSGSAAAINVAYIIGMLWCGMGMVNGTVTVGTFSAVWQLIGQITGPAMQFSGILPQYYTMTASRERLQELEDLPEDSGDPATDWPAVVASFEKITCEKLSFSYDPGDKDRSTVLKDLDFTVNRGDFIAITGESGIGKSTFLKLLLGIYQPEVPCLHVVSTDGARTPLDAGGRNMISYVPQGNFLMSGTIRDAVHFWQQESVDEEKLREACRLAEAASFIDAMQQGYDTPLGERGAGLSEGQLQRVAIARAIYSGKPVLLLDEATSALDEQTEARVLENLKTLNNRTVIIVTHRKAALDICNRIVEMENGRIREHHVL